jgi:hypothetical protein
VAAFATQATIGIPEGLAQFVEAVWDKILAVVLFDPGKDMLRIERDARDGRCFEAHEFSANEPYAIRQQELEHGVGDATQEIGEMACGWQTGTGIETQVIFMVWDQGKTEEPYETRMLQQKAMEAIKGRQGFIEAEEFCRYESRKRNGAMSPVPLKIPFWQVCPVQRSEQFPTPHNREGVGDAPG